MKRKLWTPILFNPSTSLELGTTTSEIARSTLDIRDGWNANFDSIPMEDSSLETVFAFHFLEHVGNLRWIMREIERVLVPGGRLVAVVPHYSAMIAFQDPDHVHFFTEESFRYFTRAKEGTLAGYDGERWDFEVESLFMAAIVERNLSIFTVLRKM
jgi:SAM-dependent methyltransferase